MCCAKRLRLADNEVKKPGTEVRGLGGRGWFCLLLDYKQPDQNASVQRYEDPEHPFERIVLAREFELYCFDLGFKPGLRGLDLRRKILLQRDQVTGEPDGLRQSVTKSRCLRFGLLRRYSRHFQFLGVVERVESKRCCHEVDGLGSLKTSRK